MTNPIAFEVLADRAALGEAAGTRAAEVLREAQAAGRRLRIMLAAAPSQQATLATLAAADGIDWSQADLFHMDDYIGLDADAPQGFGNWLQRFFIDLLPTQPAFHRMDVSGEPEEAAAAYAEVLGDEPFDLTLCGLGVNGHLAFNDPPADFADPLAVRAVEVAPASRKQQVDEGHFPSYGDVPSHAITVTIPRLLNARHIVCSVPGAEKRQAVTDTLRHAPDPDYPGTALKTHPSVRLYADRESEPTA